MVFSLQSLWVTQPLASTGSKSSKLNLPRMTGDCAETMPLQAKYPPGSIHQILARVNNFPAIALAAMDTGTCSSQRINRRVIFWLWGPLVRGAHGFKPQLLRHQYLTDSFVRRFAVRGAIFQIRYVGDAALVFLAVKHIDVIARFHVIKQKTAFRRVQEQTSRLRSRFSGKHQSFLPRSATLRPVSRRR